MKKSSEAIQHVFLYIISEGQNWDWENMHEYKLLCHIQVPVGSFGFYG